MAKPKTLKTALRHFIKEDIELIRLEESLEGEEDHYECKALKKQIETQNARVLKAISVICDFEMEEDEYDDVVRSLDVPDSYPLELIDYNNFF